LKTSGTLYAHKKLESSPRNWAHIIDHLSEARLVGAFARLTGDTLARLVADQYTAVGPALAEALGKAPHLVMAHESVLTAWTPSGRVSREERDIWIRIVRQMRSTPRRFAGFMDSVGLLEMHPDRLVITVPYYISTTPIHRDIETAVAAGAAAVLGREVAVTVSTVAPALEPIDGPFFQITEAERTAALALLERHGVELLPYTTNAELSVLASSFVEDHQQNLLFRVYVPAGRIYADEAERLLALFREWLTTVRSQRVRQESYATLKGQVYELFADEDGMTATSLPALFADFQRFLELCRDQPENATKALTTEGIDEFDAAAIVNKYGKEARRLEHDLRQSYELRMMQIRHRLESEVVDQAEAKASERHLIELAAQALVPEPSSLISGPASSVLQPSPPEDAANFVLNQTFNQQFFQPVTGPVIQGVQGSVNLGPEPQQLLALIQQKGGEDVTALESAVYELEDEQARIPERLLARQRLTRFLSRLGDETTTAAIDLLKAYIKSKFIGGQ
jgi:hypothetical protein